MRLIYLPLIAVMTVTAPALAGTDSSDAPNPFTEPSAGQTTTSGAVNRTDATVQPPSIPAIPGGDVGAQQGTQNNESNASNGFYRQQKKDSDSR
jgi:hypothetical protein